MKFSIDKQEKYVVFKLHEQKLNTLIAAELKSELLLLNTQGFNNMVLDLQNHFTAIHPGWALSLSEIAYAETPAVPL